MDGLEAKVVVGSSGVTTVVVAGEIDAASGQVLITDTVRTATIGSKLDVDDAGDHTLKGVPASVVLVPPPRAPRASRAVMSAS